MNTYLDLDVAVDHKLKLYQIQLHTSLSITEDDIDELVETGTISGFEASDLNYSAIIDFQRFVETMNYIRQLISNGYQPVGKGTNYPEMVLPSKAYQTMEKWR